MSLGVDRLVREPATVQRGEERLEPLWVLVQHADRLGHDALANVQYLTRNCSVPMVCHCATHQGLRTFHRSAPPAGPTMAYPSASLGDTTPPILPHGAPGCVVHSCSPS